MKNSTTPARTKPDSVVPLPVLLRVRPQSLPGMVRKGSRMVVRNHGRIAGHHQYRHRLADSASDTQHHPGGNARNRIRNHYLIYSLPLRSSQCQTGFAHGTRTVRIASSVTVMMVGNAIMASTILPASPLSPTGKSNTF